jgi:hypothetical protein
VAAVQQAVVQAEERHDGVVSLERRPEGGMIVDAEVAPEPHECRHTGGTPAADAEDEPCLPPPRRVGTMAETHVMAALVRKRAELAAELVERERGLAQLRADIAHLDGAIRLLQPAYKPASIRPKRRPTRHPRWFATGELGRLCLDALRDAAEPLPAVEIARVVMRRRGMDAEENAALRRVENMVIGVLRRREKLVEKVVIDPRGVGWKVRD